MNDWHDPFLDDEAARERERRRAEREARRRERRRAIADKVQTERPAEKPPPAKPPPQPPPERPAPPPETERPAPERPAPLPEADRPRSYIATERERLQARIANRMPRRRGQPPGAVMWRRRLAGLVVLLVLGGIVAYGAISVADRIGGDDAPPAAPELGTVTVAEGLDRRQISDVAKDAGVRGNYIKATKRSKGFNPGEFGAANADSLEGFLFPATYELPENARAEDLVSRQLEAFRENVRRVDFKQARSKNLTKYDVVKIASMIEREVQVSEERRLVAAVIYNRLAANNPLGIDATIRYEDQNYDKPLRASRLDQPTRYNTHVSAGLPPTPIGNPGLAAIKAAAKPAKVDHFYYVVKPGTCGEHFFTASEEEFNAAAARYQRALEREGGSPTDC